MTGPVVRLVLAGLPPTINAVRRMHWRERSRVMREWKERVVWSVREAFPTRDPLPVLEVALVHMTRRSTSEPDYDGLVGSFKPVCDGIVMSGLVVDDAPQHFRARYAWEKAKRGAGGIVVEVFEG